MNKRIVNIVNFVRGIEPRDPTSDLFLPTKMQMEITKAERIPTTFLLQYDAMLRDDFRSLFIKEKAPYISDYILMQIYPLPFDLCLSTF